MGHDEPMTPSKPEKAASPVKEQPVVHPYPADWAAMQAFYASGVPMPPPYFSTAVGHPPHPYMWAPQPLIAPFGSPYAAIYPPGVYPHPATGLVPSPSTTDVPAKSSNSKDKGLMKKLKGFDGLAVSIGNVNTEITVGDGSGQSQSGDNGTDGSTDGSDENNESGGKENHRKRSSEDITSGDKKAGVLAIAVNGGETSAAPNICTGFVVPPPSTKIPGVEFKLSANPHLQVGVHPDHWAKDERELKREKRKQSNRESARRSRLRKQAETEELAMKVESLGAENMTLNSEIHRLKENSEKLRAENSSLMEKLKNRQDVSNYKQENQEAPSIVVENFLSRIDELRQDENNENSNSNGGNLHQLFDSSPRTDAVAAG